ncbi:4-alpha-glucanotransferase [Palleronia sp.]|uniref:4-alpha-glucanotransferase n=1 Tax=Palleronia sp. TaxID=1940284 RepID=UPI0035C863BE
MSDRDELARALGVLPDYRDATDKVHELTPEARDAILAAFGVFTDDEVTARLARIASDRILPLWQVVEADAPLRLPALDRRSWRLLPEEGEPQKGEGADLGALPLGIHALEVEGERAWLLSAPLRLPEPPRAWGVTVPLYGLADDGRIGTYRDLQRAAESLGAAGADFIGVNPVHAGFPSDVGAFSPYAPAHRGRLATMHVYPDAEEPLPADELVDYEMALPARMEALRAAFAPDANFKAWREQQGPDLERFALHQALSARFGTYWPDWPEAMQDPEGDAVRAFADEHADEVTFHAGLQHMADRQLSNAQAAALSAGMRFGLYLDLAVGTHPAGAEAWGRPELFARGVSLGAPPDAFSAEGQSWGLAPLRPDTLAEDGFRPLQAILRSALSHAKLLRIDHILGFERAFWVPEGDPPGAYVAMPREAMLAVARIEAARAGATIVGEDLGNIPDGLREALEDSGILGCRVAQFERQWEKGDTAFSPAEAYARGALTSWGSHDLPTWEGWKQGREIDWRVTVGDMDEAAATEAHAQRKAEVAAFCDLIGGKTLDDLHAFLAETPSRLVVAQIEDLLGRVEQPNLPGTVHQHPNWRRRAEVPAEQIGQLDAVRRTSIIMGNRDR